MNEKHFRAILAELIEENPVACRGILKISELVFTTDVPTLGVSLSGWPQLRVNLDFVSRQCRTETQVKAVIMHEFLHVLLAHTERFERMTPALNLALDAVINAVIHRTLGAEYSSMMSGYYSEAEGVARLLRPMTSSDGKEQIQSRDPGQSTFFKSWKALYDGQMVVDDVLELAEMLGTCEIRELLGKGRVFLGNHEDAGGFGLGNGTISPEAEQALNETMKCLNGNGIWRSPRERGVGVSANPYQAVFSAGDERVTRWVRTAWLAFLKCLLPDRRSQGSETREQSTFLPVLNGGDRRGFLRSLWSPLFPEVAWIVNRRKPGASAQVYLDVSGSMNAEMQQIVNLLLQLRRHIRMPFWAFSDEVAPARIRNGQLLTTTSGGTSINSVLRHVAQTRPQKALIISDGYIETCDPMLLAGVKGQKLFAVISRDGSPAEFERAGIPYSQLEAFPS